MKGTPPSSFQRRSSPAHDRGSRRPARPDRLTPSSPPKYPYPQTPALASPGINSLCWPHRLSSRTFFFSSRALPPPHHGALSARTDPRRSALPRPLLSGASSAPASARQRSSGRDHGHLRHHAHAQSVFFLSRACGVGRRAQRCGRPPHLGRQRLGVQHLGRTASTLPTSITSAWWFPSHAYVPTPPPPAGSCPMSDFDEFPHIHPPLRRLLRPQSLLRPRSFAPVHYSRWPYATPGTLYVVRYTSPLPSMTDCYPVSTMRPASIA